MKGDPNTGLTAEEFQSLHDVADGLMQPIPKEHEAHLSELGYIAPKLDGLQITDAGKMRLAKDR
jgi:hypothetical protein